MAEELVLIAGDRGETASLETNNRADIEVTLASWIVMSMMHTALPWLVCVSIFLLPC